MASRANKKKSNQQPTNSVNGDPIVTQTDISNSSAKPSPIPDKATMSRVASAPQPTALATLSTDTTATTDSKVKKVVDPHRQKFVMIISLLLLLSFILMCLPFSGLSVTLDLSDLTGMTAENNSTANTANGNAGNSDENNSNNTSQTYHVNLSGLMILLTPLQGYDSVVEVIGRNIKEIDGTNDASYSFVENAINSLYDSTKLNQLKQTFWIIYSLQLIMLLSFIATILVLLLIKNNTKLAFATLISTTIHTAIAFALMLTNIIISAISVGFIVANYGLYLYFVVALGTAIIALLLKKEIAEQTKKELKTKKGSTKNA